MKYLILIYSVITSIVYAGYSASPLLNNECYITYDNNTNTYEHKFEKEDIRDSIKNSFKEIKQGTSLKMLTYEQCAEQQKQQISAIMGEANEEGENYINKCRLEKLWYNYYKKPDEESKGFCLLFFTPKLKTDTENKKWIYSVITDNLLNPESNINGGIRNDEKLNELYEKYEKTRTELMKVMKKTQSNLGFEVTTSTDSEIGYNEYPNVTEELKKIYQETNKNVDRFKEKLHISKIAWQQVRIEKQTNEIALQGTSTEENLKIAQEVGVNTLSSIFSLSEDKSVINQIGNILSSPFVSVWDKRKASKEEVKLSLKEKFDLLEVLDEENDFVSKCDTEIKEASFDLTWGVNLNVSKVLKKQSQEIDKAVQNSINEIRDTLLFYSSDEFIMALVLDKVIELVAKQKCNVGREMIQNNAGPALLATIDNNFAKIFESSVASIVKKNCSSKAISKKNIKMGESETEGDVFGTWFNSIISGLPVEYGVDAGISEQKGDTAETEFCDIDLNELGEEYFDECIPINKAEVTRKLQKFLKKFSKQIEFQQAATKKCLTSKEILFTGLPSNTKEDASLKKELGLITSKGCGVKCDAGRKFLKVNKDTGFDFSDNEGVSDDDGSMSKTLKEIEKSIGELKSIELLLELEQNLQIIKRREKEMNIISSVEYRVASQTAINMFQDMLYKTDILNKKVFLHSVGLKNTEIETIFSSIGIDITNLDSFRNKLGTYLTEREEVRNNETVPMVIISSGYEDLIIDLTKDSYKNISKWFMKNIYSNLNKKENNNAIFNKEKFIFSFNDLNKYGIIQPINLPINKLNNDIKRKLNNIFNSESLGVKIKTITNNNNNNTLLSLENKIKAEYSKYEKVIKNRNPGSIIDQNNPIGNEKTIFKLLEQRSQILTLYYILNNYGNYAFKLSELRAQLNNSERIRLEGLLLELIGGIKVENIEIKGMNKKILQRKVEWNNIAQKKEEKEKALKYIEHFDTKMKEPNN